MNVSLHQTAAALNANARRQDIIANNLASASNPGFKHLEVPFGTGQAGQGVLEMSNVKVVEGMITLIPAQHAYQANSEAVQTADEMLQTSNNLRR